MMAKDKRTPLSTDMNDIDLNDPGALTDQEREALQDNMSKSEESTDDKKAM